MSKLKEAVSGPGAGKGAVGLGAGAALAVLTMECTGMAGIVWDNPDYVASALTVLYGWVANRVVRITG